MEEAVRIAPVCLNTVFSSEPPLERARDQSSLLQGISLVTQIPRARTGALLVEAGEGAALPWSDCHADPRDLCSFAHRDFLQLTG